MINMAAEDVELFKKRVNHLGGPENILAILFDNSASKVMGPGMFTKFEDVLVEDIEALVFVEFDNKSRPYYVVKALSDIQGFIGKDPACKLEEYDVVGLRG